MKPFFYEEEEEEVWRVLVKGVGQAVRMKHKDFIFFSDYRPSS